MSANALRPNAPIKPGYSAPERYRCSLGGEWRPLSGFSKRQQKLMETKFKNRKVNAANTGMICRIHSGEPVKEIQCEGPCNEVRVLDDFSKNNRTNGVYVCKLCQHWTNTQEPGYSPWAAPKNRLDPLEEMDDFEGRMPTEPSDIFDFHSGNDKPLAPVTNTFEGTTRAVSKATDPSLRAEDNGPRKVAHTTTVSGSVGPISRAPASVVSDDTSISRLTELCDNAAWFKTAAVAQEKVDKKASYNGWDSNGQLHSMKKTPSFASRSAPSMAGNPQKPQQTGRPNNVFPGENRAQAIDPFLKHNPFPPSANRSQPSAGKGGFGSAPERQGDRKQMTQREHREIQRSMPQRRIVMPGQDEDGEDEDSS